MRMGGREAEEEGKRKARGGGREIEMRMGVGLDKLCSEFCLLFYSLMLQFSAYYSFNFTYYSFTMTIILFRNAHTNNIIQLHQHLLYCNNRYLNVVFQCRSLRFRKCICQNGKTLSAAADDGCTSSIFLKTLAQ